MERRSFISTILSFGAAPAIVQASSLMPLWTPKLILWGDGIHDDSEALEAWLNGGRVLRPNKKLAEGFLSGVELYLGHDILIKPGSFRTLQKVRIYTPKASPAREIPEGYPVDYRGSTDFSVLDHVRYP